MHIWRHKRMGTDRQTDKHTKRLTDRHTHRLSATKNVTNAAVPLFDW